MSQEPSAGDQQGVIRGFEVLESDVEAEIETTVDEKGKVDRNRNSRICCTGFQLLNIASDCDLSV